MNGVCCCVMQRHGHCCQETCERCVVTHLATNTTTNTLVIS